MANALYYGDNLDVLRHEITSASIDLIYLDPPFNSQANYNVLFKSPSGKAADAQIEAFEDTWHWGEEAARAFAEVLASPATQAAELLRAMRSFLGENDMMAYLAMMAVRLIELHRVLKPTGSLYLHCDPTASHYLKILLDGIFGPRNFLNEIIWKRTSAHSSAKRYGPVHDVILFYSRGEEHIWYRLYQPYDQTSSTHSIHISTTMAGAGAGLTLPELGFGTEKPGCPGAVSMSRLRGAIGLGRHPSSKKWTAAGKFIGPRKPGGCRCLNAI